MSFHDRKCGQRDVPGLGPAQSPRRDHIHAGQVPRRGRGRRRLQHLRNHERLYRRPTQQGRRLRRGHGKVLREPAEQHDFTREDVVDAALATHSHLERLADANLPNY